ncbi:MAG: beta-eliminating lyase-related protein, partial [Bacillota bacterium]|nr:beta-eliminating lyase-related protein [Bacillota bacterium]
MLNFLNDYEFGCIPEILDQMQTINEETNMPYGQDPYTKRAQELLQSKMPDVPVDIHFIYGGTMANLIMVRSCLKSYESIIAVDKAHINLHEASAIETTRHKILVVKNVNGKITPQAIQKAFLSETAIPGHMTYPKAVFITNATEMGTVYSAEELRQIRAVCDDYDLYLIMDGSRLGSALVSEGVDYTLQDIARWCDMFVLGG